jgi:UDP-N-acetylmuramoylalanine--D-glutamate ligase
MAAALLLRREGIPVYASDRAAEPDYSVGAEGIRRLQEAGVEVQLGGHDLKRIERAGLVVVSPGIPPNAPPVLAARAAGVPVVSEVDVGYHAMPAVKYAAITGTNGKTTTTALTGHLLQSAGLKAVAAGNIGRPLSQVALDNDRPEWIALELSSFQLHDTHDLVPAVGAMTNLAPDHLDRYATLEEYYADKDRLFVNATAASCWVTNGDDAEVERRSAAVPGTRLRFRLQERADAWYDRSKGALILRDSPLLSRADFPLLGEHNVANALAASLIAWRAAGVLSASRQGCAPSARCRIGWSRSAPWTVSCGSMIRRRPTWPRPPSQFRRWSSPSSCSSAEDTRANPIQCWPRPQAIAAGRSSPSVSRVIW